MNVFDNLEKVKDKEVKTQKIVAPVKVKMSESQQQFSLWINKDLLQEVKILAVTDNVAVKDLINDALIMYLKKRKNK